MNYYYSLVLLLNYIIYYSAECPGVKTEYVNLRNFKGLWRLINNFVFHDGLDGVDSTKYFLIAEKYSF
jgi:hypothetical protein